MTFRAVAELVRETFDEWTKDNVPRLGAALAYYTVLSIAPLLIVVVAVAGMAYGEQAAQGQIVWQLQSLLGFQLAQAIQGIVVQPGSMAKGFLPRLLVLPAWWLAPHWWSPNCDPP